jgi:putative phosphoesterase
MKKILLLSDTHGHIDERILKYAQEADEIWHAGDIGDLIVTDTLAQIKPLRSVHGNIDGSIARVRFPENNIFTVEGLKFLITHIGGPPGKYTSLVREVIDEIKPDIFICGHSHILKVVRIKGRDMMHLNPGAAGIHGFHQIRTMVRFEVAQGKLQNMEVVELGLRGKSLAQTVQGTN